MNKGQFKPRNKGKFKPLSWMVADNNRDARERGRWGNMYVKPRTAQ